MPGKPARPKSGYALFLMTLSFRLRTLRSTIRSLQRVQWDRTIILVIVLLMEQKFGCLGKVFGNIDMMIILSLRQLNFCVSLEPKEQRDDFFSQPRNDSTVNAYKPYISLECFD